MLYEYNIWIHEIGFFWITGFSFFCWGFNSFCVCSHCVMCYQLVFKCCRAPNLVLHWSEFIFLPPFPPSFSFSYQYNKLKSNIVLPYVKEETLYISKVLWQIQSETYFFKVLILYFTPKPLHYTFLTCPKLECKALSSFTTPCKSDFVKAISGVSYKGKTTSVNYSNWYIKDIKSQDTGGFFFYKWPCHLLLSDLTEIKKRHYYQYFPIRKLKPDSEKSFLKA